MRIVVWGINYAPEVTGIAPYNAGLCRYLLAQGHDVQMVSSFSYYPQWRKAEVDRGRWFRLDRDEEGVPVHRCWHYVPSRPSTMKRIVHEFSFGLTSLGRVLLMPRADVYVVVSPPLILGPLAWVATRIKRSRYLFHVQDLQPDAALGLGMVKPGVFTRMLYAVEAFSYRHAAAVGGISQGMLDAFARKGVPEHKRWYLPNWVPKPAVRGPAEVPVADFRRIHRIASQAFLAVYSGNVGNKQGLGVLLEAALLLERESADGMRPLEIVIAGDGAARAALEARHAELGLKRVRLLPLLGDEDYRAMLASADVALITQEKGTGQFFFPSKLLTVLGAGLPVLAVADEESELARALFAGRCGWVVPPGRAELLAEKLREVAALPASERAEVCVRGAAFNATFAAERVLPAWEARLVQLGGAESASNASG